MSFNMEFVERGQYLFYNTLKLNWISCKEIADTITTCRSTPFSQLVALFRTKFSFYEQAEKDVTDYFQWSTHQYIDETRKAGFIDPVSDTYALSMIFRNALTGRFTFTQRGINNFEAEVAYGESILQEIRASAPERIEEAVTKVRSYIASGPMEVKLGYAMSTFVNILNPNDGRDALMACISKRVFKGVCDAPGFCWQFFSARPLYAKNLTATVQNNMNAMLNELARG